MYNQYLHNCFNSHVLTNIQSVSESGDRSSNNSNYDYDNFDNLGVKCLAQGHIGLSQWIRTRVSHTKGMCLIHI